jgi:hypothetical protein
VSPDALLGDVPVACERTHLETVRHETDRQRLVVYLLMHKSWTFTGHRAACKGGWWGTGIIVDAWRGGSDPCGR